jgi:hypothetical protein
MTHDDLPEIRPEALLRFVEIEPFPRHWSKQGLDDGDLQSLQIAIMAAPASHPIIPGSNGLRKLRFSRPGSHSGKRGSYRVYYAYFEGFGIVLLMAILAKNERSDLSKADLKVMASILGQIKKLLDERVIR